MRSFNFAHTLSALHTPFLSTSERLNLRLADTELRAHCVRCTALLLEQLAGSVTCEAPSTSRIFCCIALHSGKLQLISQPLHNAVAAVRSSELLLSTLHCLLQLALSLG